MDNCQNCGWADWAFNEKPIFPTFGHCNAPQPYATHGNVYQCPARNDLVWQQPWLECPCWRPTDDQIKSTRSRESFDLDQRDKVVDALTRTATRVIEDTRKRTPGTPAVEQVGATFINDLDAAVNAVRSVWG